MFFDVCVYRTSRARDKLSQVRNQRSGGGSWPGLGAMMVKYFSGWPVPGFEDTELRVFMEPEVDQGETEIYAGVRA